jgi:hypothetical protein
MSGGAVRGNTVSSPSWSHGGGVYVAGDGSFSMSGGEVSGNILPAGTNSYGREVLIYGIFKMSGEARPDRVLLSNNNQFITIGGPLSGGTVPIDLGVTSSDPLTDWVGKQILRLDGSYSAGNLASLTTHFTLENSVRINLVPFIETPITGYKIDDGGYFVAQ